MFKGRRHQSAAGGKALLAQQLPPSPAPQCAQCSKPIPMVKTLNIELVTHASYKVTCIAVCPGCGARHFGTRSIGLSGGTTRFLFQEFEPFSEEKHGQLLKDILAQITKKSDKFGSIQAKPVTPHSSEGG